jgi:hypothetical protein
MITKQDNEISFTAGDVIEIVELSNQVYLNIDYR